MVPGAAFSSHPCDNILAAARTFLLECSRALGAPAAPGAAPTATGLPGPIISDSEVMGCAAAHRSQPRGGGGHAHVSRPARPGHFGAFEPGGFPGPLRGRHDVPNRKDR